MPSSNSLSGLIKWLGREEWRGPFEEILDLHLGPASQDAGVELNEIVEILGDHDFRMLWGCAFEDLLTATAVRRIGTSSTTTSAGVQILAHRG
jgi:hypothetical protein